MENLVKVNELFVDGYFKFTDIGDNPEEAKIWLEDMVAGEMYRIASVQSDDDFEADGPDGLQWVALDCLRYHGVSFELFAEKSHEY